MNRGGRSAGTSVPRRFARLALLGMMISGSASVFAGTGNGDLTDSNINYIGRWDKTSSTTYRSYWGGASLTTRFTGTTVKVKLAEKTVFMAVIDGVANTYWDASGTVDLTSTPLASGTHTLRIVSKYEKTELPFQGLVLDAGATTVKPPSSPLVEFVGVPDFFTTNIAFGGADMRTAWITMSGSGKLARMRWPRPGLRLEGQC